MSGSCLNVVFSGPWPPCEAIWGYSRVCEHLHPPSALAHAFDYVKLCALGRVSLFTVLERHTSAVYWHASVCQYVCLDVTNQALVCPFPHGESSRDHTPQETQLEGTCPLNLIGPMWTFHCTSMMGCSASAHRWDLVPFTMTDSSGCIVTDVSCSGAQHLLEMCSRLGSAFKTVTPSLLSWHVLALKTQESVLWHF